MDLKFSVSAASASAAGQLRGAVFSGCDLVFLPEFHERTHEKFLERAFGEEELREARGRFDSTAALAARWAAKEAAYKAFSQLASALGLPAEGLAIFRHYQVGADGPRPILRLQGRPAQIVEETRASVSLSLTHDGDYAAAFVVIGIDR
jgi:phosphopantetheine--protein transferase-like protein